MSISMTLCEHKRDVRKFLWSGCLPKGFLARMAWSASSGSESPSSLTAVTLNLYWWPGSRPSTLKKGGATDPGHCKGEGFWDK